MRGSGRGMCILKLRSRRGRGRRPGSLTMHGKRQSHRVHSLSLLLPPLNITPTAATTLRFGRRTLKPAARKLAGLLISREQSRVLHPPHLTAPTAPAPQPPLPLPLRTPNPLLNPRIPSPPTPKNQTTTPSSPSHPPAAPRISKRRIKL